MGHQRDEIAEAYAKLNLGDSTMQLEALAYESKKLASLLQERRAESEW
jgi:hypothetical protein